MNLSNPFASKPYRYYWYTFQAQVTSGSFQWLRYNSENLKVNLSSIRSGITQMTQQLPKAGLPLSNYSLLIDRDYTRNFRTMFCHWIPQVVFLAFCPRNCVQAYIKKLLQRFLKKILLGIHNQQSDQRFF